MRGRALGPGRLWKRGRSYLLDWRDETGKRHHRVLSTDKRTAEEIRIELVRQRDLARAGLGDRAGQERPLAEVVEAYLVDLKPRVVARHYAQVESRLAKVVAKLPGIRVGDLRAADIARLRAEVVAAGHGARAANLLADGVRACLRWAVDAELVAKNPIAKLKRLPEAGHERRRRRALSEDEIRRLLEEADADDAKCGVIASWEGRVRVPQRVLFQTLVESGLRYGEARLLRWGDVDLGQRLLVVRAENAKSRKQRVVPVRAEVGDELRALKLLHERVLRRLPSSVDAVFLSADGVSYGGPTTNLMRVFHRLLRRAGIPRVDVEGRSVDLHSLRHTAASRLVRAGVSIVHVQRLLGHADVRTTASIYTHVGVDDLRTALDAADTAGMVSRAVAAAR